MAKASPKKAVKKSPAKKAAKATPTKKTVTKKAKKEKDPNAPKRAGTAYMLWLSSVRPQLTKPGMGVTDVAKLAGEKWRGMTAAQKAPWEKKAQEDKARYEKEMAKYKK